MKNLSTIVHERDAIAEADYFGILNNLHKLQVSDRRMIALLLLTGMRRGEVLGLRWEDIDFDDKLIHVQQGVVYTDNAPLLTIPKTKKGYRSIPLDDRLVEHLKPIQGTGYVIGGNEPITKSSLTKLLRRVNKTIDMHGATPHILRHTYATLLNNAGVNPKTIQYILGHADISTTMNRYTHSSMENVREAGRLLCAKLGVA